MAKKKRKRQTQVSEYSGDCHCELTVQGKTVTQNFSPEEAIELGQYLIAGGHHALRSLKDERQTTTPKSTLVPVNTVQITTHKIGDVDSLKRRKVRFTVLGRYLSRRKPS